VASDPVGLGMIRVIFILSVFLLGLSLGLLLHYYYHSRRDIAMAHADHERQWRRMVRWIYLLSATVVLLMVGTAAHLWWRG
jgi:hypothetical protein